MKVIAEVDGGKLPEENYVCRPGQPLEALTLIRVYLWACEATDEAVKKVNPNTTWKEYEKYLTTRFRNGSSIFIKIQKRNGCPCEHCKE